MEPVNLSELNGEALMAEAKKTHTNTLGHHWFYGNCFNLQNVLSGLQYFQYFYINALMFCSITHINAEGLQRCAKRNTIS